MTLPRPREDRGAVLVWVGASLVALLGMGALVLDVGALYQERRELQNGADAAALAVAKDCAEGDCLDEHGTADHFADENANDAASTVDIVCGDGPGLAACPDPPAGAGAEGVSGWVLVTASTDNPANAADSAEIPFVLAPVLDAANVGGTVHATAVAAWGPLGRATTLPLIFSTCEFFYLGGQLEPPEFPTGEAVIDLHDNEADLQDGAQDCPVGPAGSDYPISGGFGWLGDSEDCEVDVTVGEWVDDQPGVANPGSLGCDASEWQDGQERLIPLYDTTNDLTGSNGQYHVEAFVGFIITGYRFSGEVWNNPDCGGPGNSGRCIVGEFTRVVTIGDGFGGDDYGATVVKMIG